VTTRGRLAAGTLTAAAGALLLAYQIDQVGWETIQTNLAQVGGWFAAILVVSFGRFVLRSVAWTTLVGESALLGPAIAATLAGDALGNLTPLGLAASEPAKALYLGRIVGSARALAALAVENFFYSVSVAIYIMTGTALMLTIFNVPPALQWAGVAALTGMTVVLAGAAWLAWQRPQVLSAVLARVPIRKLSAVVDRVRDFETQTYGTVGGERGRLIRVIACHAGFHVLSFVECWLTLSLLTGESRPAAAFVLDTVNRVVNIVFKVVPAQVGVGQWSSETFALAIGLPRGAGTSLGLVRLGRLLVWAAVGLVVLVKRGTTSR